MFNVRIKFPAGSSVVISGHTDELSANNYVQSQIDLLTSYERANRHNNSFTFEVRHPRPNVTELYIPVQTTYRTFANLRVMFVVTEEEKISEQKS